MEQVIDVLLTFVRDNLILVLGIMVVGVLYLLVDREWTFLCPDDEAAMKRVDTNIWQCPRCGLFKRV